MQQPREFEIQTQKPNFRGFLGAVKYDFYWKCLSSTILVHLCIYYAAWCHVKHYAYAAQLTFTYSYGPCSQGYNFIPIAFGTMLYFIYIMECWHSRVKFNKIRKVGFGEAVELIDKMRCAPPIVWWKSICYHYVRRTRQMTRYRNGEAITATQAFYEKVNSNCAGKIFAYEGCGAKDISKILIDLDRSPVTRIKFSKAFVFACIQAANEFEAQRTHFFNEHEMCDDYMEVREGLDLAGQQFVDQMIIYSTPNNKCPWYFSSMAFWFFSVLLLSWPLRLLCELRTAHVQYQITKLFGMNYLSPSSVNYTGPLELGVRFNSRELAVWMGTENFYAIPSYSEAMRLDPRINDQRCTPPNFVNDSSTYYGSIDVQTSAENSLHSGVRSIFNRAITAQLRSRSFSLSNIISRRLTRDILTPSTSSTALSRSINGAPTRSASTGGFSVWRSLGYESISEENTNERHPLIEQMMPIDEPPPPYEIAIRMCAPLYERLRRSANSIASRLSSISHSSSKDLPFRRHGNI